MCLSDPISLQKLNLIVCWFHRAQLKVCIFYVLQAMHNFMHVENSVLDLDDVTGGFMFNNGYKSIHLITARPVYGHREADAYPRMHRAQGWGSPWIGNQTLPGNFQMAL